MDAPRSIHPSPNPPKQPKQSKQPTQLIKPNWPEQKQAALLGCSGGADSVALLLLALEAGWQEHLQVVYCHHGLRAEAEAEAEFVAQLCQQRQLSFHLRHLNLNPASNNLQAQAREARLKAFASIAQEAQLKLLFLAHHQDDQAETVLWHLLRGSGSKGLSGMSLQSPLPFQADSENLPKQIPEAEQLQIHRPLLTTRRTAIEAYLKQRGQTWCTDSSNQKLNYQRNRLRLQALPQLAQITGREILKPLARSAEILAAEDALISELSQQSLNQLQQADTQSLDCHGLLELPLALQRRVLQDWLQAQKFSARFDQIESLRQVAAAVNSPGGSPARLQLSHNLEVRRQNAQLNLSLLRR